MVRQAHLGLLFGGTFDPEGRVAAERVSVVPACTAPSSGQGGAAGRRALVALGYLNPSTRSFHSLAQD
jgi:hypothetical protein